MKSTWARLYVSIVYLTAILQNVFVCSDKINLELVSTKIVGGDSISEPKIYPWFARFKNGVICGGVLVSPEYLMTAAHCVKNPDWLEYSGRIQIGALCHPYSKESNCGQTVEERGIQKIYIHPDYNKETNEYDVALVRLDQESKIKPVDIDRTGISTFYNKKQSLFAVGLGYLNESNDDTPSQLHHVEVSNIPGHQCLSLFNGTEYQNQLNLTVMICAGSKGKDACKGEINSLYQNEEEALYLIFKFAAIYFAH